jgi:hypothetical protein
VALSPNPHEGEMAQAPILMGGSIQGSHPAKLCGIQDPAEPYSEDGGGTPRPTRTLSAALGRQQLEQLESNHLETWATENEGEVYHRRQKHSPRKGRNGGTPVGYSGRIPL